MRWPTELQPQPSVPSYSFISASEYTLDAHAYRARTCIWRGAGNAKLVNGPHPQASGELEVRESGGEAVTNTSKRSGVGDQALASYSEQGYSAGS